MPSIYELAPSVFLSNQSRIDSSVKNLREQYERDKAFFSKHPSRKSFIRRNGPGELDLALPIGQWLKAPALWLYVSKVAHDTHIVLPVYRGKQFWAEPEDDNTVALVLVEMANREGIALSEWTAFATQTTAEFNAALAKQNVTTH